MGVTNDLVGVPLEGVAVGRIVEAGDVACTRPASPKAR